MQSSSRMLESSEEGMRFVDMAHANVTLPDYLLVIIPLQPICSLLFFFLYSTSYSSPKHPSLLEQYDKAPFCWVIEEANYFGRICSTISLQLNFERSYIYYILNIVIVEICLLFVGCAAWAIENPDQRLQFDVVLILTDLSFRFMLSNKLPEVAYLTLMDVYILVCFMAKCFALACHVLHACVPIIATQDAENVSLGIYCFTICVMHALFLRRARNQRLLREQVIQEQCEACNKHNNEYMGNYMKKKDNSGRDKQQRHSAKQLFAGPAAKIRSSDVSSKQPEAEKKSKTAFLGSDSTGSALQTREIRVRSSISAGLLLRHL